jgi:ketosteroid isomerase-like protein
MKTVNDLSKAGGHLFTCIIVLLVGLFGCSRTAPKTDLNLATVEKELQELRYAHRTAIDLKDIGGVLKFYSPDLITLSQGQPIQYGPEFIRPLMEELYRTYDFHEDFILSDIHIIGDRALATLIYEQKMTPLGGGVTVNETGRGMCIFKKSETGIWQFEWNTYFPDSIPPRSFN